MNAIEQGVLLAVSGLIVAFRIYFLGRCWTTPLRHGEGFFFDIEVPPGFYGGPGTRWIKRYHVVLLLECLIEFIALAAIIAAGRLYLIPAWAGGGAAVLMGTLWTFIAVARRSLGGSPRMMPAVAVSLERRRFRDHVSWPLESLAAVALGLSWLLILAGGGAPVHWQYPAIMTFLVLVLVACRAIFTPSRVLLPAERTAEYHHWSVEYRRHRLWLVDSLRWLLTFQLFATYALQFWPPASSLPSLRWVCVALLLALWALWLAILIRDARRLSLSGQDLRPHGSWSGPFRR